ncbi:MAG: DUF3783 domain-containing protein [Firmicutes bacterium]|nr:DUF3783 domain-containing protein [Bacillota bacterium]
MILLYRLEEHPLLPAIRMLCAMYGHEARIIGTNEIRQPLRQLVSAEPGTFLPFAVPATAPVDQVPEEELILFAGMDQEQVSHFVDQLKALSKGTSSKILKAMLTPTNAEWSTLYLLEHLQEERAYYQNRRNRP